MGFRRGTVATWMLGVASLPAWGWPALADDNNLALSGLATITTDYVFRGITQTAQNAAVQAEFDVTYGIFYAGVWGSNVDFGGTPFGADVSSVELDYYAGITPTWQGVDFDIAGLYYTYPGAYDPGGEFDFFELKTAASYNLNDNFGIGITNYWAPEFGGETGPGDALELSASYAFAQKWWIFTPSVSGLIGWQWVEDLDNYTYWNVGLTLEFAEHWSADVRYWDTDGLLCPHSGVGACDSRVVGSVTASF